MTVTPKQTALRTVSQMGFKTVDTYEHTTIRPGAEEVNLRPLGHSRPRRKQGLLIQRLRHVDGVDLAKVSQVEAWKLRKKSSTHACPAHYTTHASRHHDGVRAGRTPAARIRHELLRAFVRHEVDRCADGVAQEMQAIAGVES